MDNARRLIAEAVQSGRTLSDLSRAIGRNHAYLQQFMSRGVPRNLPEDARERLAVVLGVDEGSLRSDSRAIPLSDGPTPPKTRIIPGADLVGATDFPVYAATKGGGTGHLIISTDPIHWVRRPFFLVGVVGAYGISVDGESMIPAYRPNDIALVNPNLQPESDTDVVLYDHDPVSGEAESILKHLISFTEKNWKLEQYRPAKIFTEHRADWPICHRVVGKYDRRR